MYLLGVRQKLVESMFVVVQTGHCHEETLNDLPGLPSVVRLRVRALQAVQSRLYRLGNTAHECLGLKCIYSIIKWNISVWKM